MLRSKREGLGIRISMGHSTRERDGIQRAMKTMLLFTLQYNIIARRKRPCVIHLPPPWRDLTYSKDDVVQLEADN